jgi:hypothetical protein
LISRKCWKKAKKRKLPDGLAHSGSKRTRLWPGFFIPQTSVGTADDIVIAEVVFRPWKTPRANRCFPVNGTVILSILPGHATARSRFGKREYVFDPLWHNADADGASLRRDRISMDFEFLAYLSWRELLAAVVVLLVIYILITYLRINRLENETRLVQELSPETIRSAVQSYAEVQAPDPVPEAPTAPVKTTAQVASEDRSKLRKGQAFAWNEPPSENPEPYRIEVLEQDMAQLRREIGGLRAELQTLRAEVQTLREEQQREISKVQGAQNVSPFYSDAMQLARQGRDAGDISVLCGISRAEAELVVTLARNNGQALD